MASAARAVALSCFRVALWATAAGGLLAGGLYVVGVAAVFAGKPSGQELGSVQHAALFALYVAVLRQALLPHAALALVTWLVLAQVAPSLERSWRRIVPGTLIASAVWFPLIGGYTFEMWEPGNAMDVVNTACLLTGSVAAALLLPRWLLPGLRPGRVAGLFQRQNPS